MRVFCKSLAEVIRLCKVMRAVRSLLGLQPGLSSAKEHPLISEINCEVSLKFAKCGKADLKLSWLFQSSEEVGASTFQLL